MLYITAADSIMFLTWWRKNAVILTDLNGRGSRSNSAYICSVSAKTPCLLSVVLLCWQIVDICFIKIWSSNNQTGPAKFVLSFDPQQLFRDINSLTFTGRFFVNGSFPQTPWNRKWLCQLGMLFCSQTRGSFFFSLWDYDGFFSDYSRTFMHVHIKHDSGIFVTLPPPNCSGAWSWDSIFLPGSRRCPTAPCWSQVSPRTILADTHV